MIAMDSLISALQQPFFLRSIRVVIALSTVFPLYGNIVVARQEANIAHTFAHIGLLGVAVGLWFDRSVERSILGSVVLTVLLIYLLGSIDTQHQVAHNEIGAQLGLVGAILIVSQMSGYRADITSYLFGDILLLGRQDVLFVVLIAASCTALYYVCRRRWYGISIDTSLAMSKGIPVRVSYILYLLTVGVLIGGAMKIIGVLLVSAFLILPSNIARRLSRDRVQWNWIGSIVCVVIGLLALFLSRQRDTPSGATIIALLLIAYLGTIGCQTALGQHP